MTRLDDALLGAHAAGDLPALIGLYELASEQAQTRAAAQFYLTHAYVFALEAGDSRAAALHARLKDWGCEA